MAPAKNAKVARSSDVPALSECALNRATLARQSLLARADEGPVAMAERLVGLQAQAAEPPFVGLWTRLSALKREDVLAAIHARQLVRGTAMRGTLHLMSARDFKGLRGACQPGLTAGMRALLKGREDALDIGELCAFARTFFDRAPRPFQSLRDAFAARDPKGDARAMAFAVRMHLPIVEVPDASASSRWGFAASPGFAAAETWLASPVDLADDAERLVVRYLGAFGPASAADLQAWSGRKDLKEALSALEPRLVRFATGRRLVFDLPDAPRPPETASAPVRFLPEFDNLLLSHADRRRFLADEHRSRVYLPALRVSATFLVDGRVAGTWKTARTKSAATLEITPFAALAKGARSALAEEAERLLEFVADDAKTRRVAFLP